MRSGIFLTVIVLTDTAFAGSWDIGGKVSVLQDGDGPGLKAVVTTEYQILSALSWRTDIEAQFLDLADKGQFDLSVPTNLLWYPLAHSVKIDPYIGPGLSFTFTHENLAWLGANALVGVTFITAKNRKFGVEAKYNVPNVFNWTGRDNFEVGLTGKWEFEFGRARG